ncbi:hypothetical protein [Nocardia sp. NPDC004860]|uniref:hypothetical protein n=1 Tax=Nocardia sp. NPDC004860 TaxID=3154557 RepID=UPI0033B525D3
MNNDLSSFSRRLDLIALQEGGSHRGLAEAAPSCAPLVQAFLNRAVSEAVNFVGLTEVPEDLRSLTEETPLSPRCPDCLLIAQ